MDLKGLIGSKGRPGMVVISDVDGVHTSPSDGAKITARPSSEHGALFTFEDGVQTLNLVRADGDRNEQFCVAGFDGDAVMEFYRFHTPDGQAIIDLQRYNIRTIIVSGRNAAPVHYRFSIRLGVAETHLGVADKLAFFQSIEGGLNFSNTIFISDGHQDAPLLRAVSAAGGIAVATADGESDAKAAADAVTTLGGGRGAFAELVKVYLAHCYPE